MRKMLHSNASLRPQLQVDLQTLWLYMSKMILIVNESRGLNVMKTKTKLLPGQMACITTCLPSGLFLSVFACELVFMLYSTSKCLTLTVRLNPPEAMNITILNLHHVGYRNIESSCTTAHIIEAVKRTF